jgi:hypothetical protein
MPRIVLVCLLALSACSNQRLDTGATRPESVRIVSGAGEATSISTTASHRPSTITMPLTADQVWRALPVAYQRLEIPVADLQTATRVIGNSNLRLRRRFAGANLNQFIDCGSTQSGANADSYEVQLSILTQVQPRDDGRSTLTTTVEAMARPVNFAGAFSRCFSRGTLERRIAELVEAESSR